MQPQAQKGNASAVNNLGVIYENCYRNTETAVSYYTLAARMGDNSAMTSLARLGRPVPQADIAQQRRAASEAEMRMGLQLMQMGRPQAPSPSYGGVSQGAAFFKRSYQSGMNRICIYDRLGSEVAITVGAADLCPLNLP